MFEQISGDLLSNVGFELVGVGVADFFLLLVVLFSHLRKVVVSLLLGLEVHFVVGVVHQLIYVI